MANTGNKGYTFLLKVVDGGEFDGQALDVNNNLVSASGLQQAVKFNTSGEPDYIEPFLSPSCLVGGTSVQIINNLSDSEIQFVFGISGFTLSDSLFNQGVQNGTHSGFTGGITVAFNVFNSSTPSQLVLEINGLPEQTITLNQGASRTATFESRTYASSDNILIILQQP